MNKLTEKDRTRRLALCKALFLAPREIFSPLYGYIDVLLDCSIRDQTDYLPGPNFPLDFWTDREPDTPAPYPPKVDRHIDKDPEERAFICKMIYLTPPGMFRDIERYFNGLIISYIEEKTGKKPNKKYPLEFWISKGPEQTKQ